MDKILIVLCSILGLSMIFLASSEGAVSVLLVLFLAIPAIFIFQNYTEEKTFLTNVFLAALLLRLGLGLIIHLFDLRAIFGPDSELYNDVGQRLAEIWQGLPVPDDEITLRTTEARGSGWGMFYVVGCIYFICGQSRNLCNPLIVKNFFCTEINHWRS